MSNILRGEATNFLIYEEEASLATPLEGLRFLAANNDQVANKKMTVLK